MTRLLLGVLLSVSLVAQAETPSTPAAAPKKVAAKKTVQLGPVEVNGKREVAVGLVLQRDQSIKSELDRSVDEHVIESARH